MIETFFNDVAEFIRNLIEMVVGFVGMIFICVFVIVIHVFIYGGIALIAYAVFKWALYWVQH